MKKIFLTFFLAFFILLLTGCSNKPELDFENAKTNLENNGYKVQMCDSYSLDIDVEKELYGYNDDEHIYITLYKDVKAARLAYKAMKYSNEYSIKALEIELKIFNNKLDKYKSELSPDEIEIFEKQIDNLEKQIKNLKENYVLGRSGKIIWHGTQQGISDSK